MKYENELYSNLKLEISFSTLPFRPYHNNKREKKFRRSCGKYLESTKTEK